MFKKGKKNQTQITLDDIDQIIEPANTSLIEITQTLNKKVQTVKPAALSFQEDEKEELAIHKKVKINAAPIASEAYNQYNSLTYSFSNYSSDYLRDLQQQNIQDNYQAQQQFDQVEQEKEELSKEEKEEEELPQESKEYIEIESSEDDEDVQIQTKKAIDEKRKKKNDSSDYRFDEPNDNKRIPFGAKLPKIHHEMLSSEEDDEFATLEQSIIKNNSSKAARIYQHTLYQNNNYKQFQFNNSKQKVSSRFLQKITNMSFQGVLSDIDHNIKVEEDQLKVQTIELEQMLGSVEESRKLLKQWRIKAEEIETKLLDQEEIQAYLEIFSDMMKDKGPFIFKAFEEFEKICSEYNQEILKKIKKGNFVGQIIKADAFQVDDVERQYSNLFGDEALFLLQDFRSALRGIMQDVDDALLTLTILYTQLQNYYNLRFKYQIDNNSGNTEVKQKIVTIIGPLFKYIFLTKFLEEYCNLDHNTSYDTDIFEELIKVDEGYFLGSAEEFALLILDCAKTCLKPILLMNPFQPPIVQFTFKKLLQYTYQYAKEAENQELMNKSLLIIKQLLEILVPSLQLDCRIFSNQKLQNILLFKGILPERNLKQLIECCTFQMNQELNDPKYLNFRHQFIKIMSILQ